MKLKEIRNAQNIGDLDALGLGRVDFEISYRGGGLGFYSSKVADVIGVRESDLPIKFGASCNYLGGGVRGSISQSGFHPSIVGRKRKLLEAISEACVRVYQNLEDETGLNDDSEDEPNWDARATKANRDAGIISAY
jgi:hypothetical protein